MRTRLCTAALGLLLVAGCGVTLDDEPEPIAPPAGTTAPTPTVTVLPTPTPTPTRPPAPATDDDGAGPTRS
ncbi:hypothetical protein Ae717Ps2_0133c [Pseudonocardia sp. Ae717_Ps2]|uniref:hypothetical protein n=1 Tax=unclassified Pseudonocardia TaxID=2619320 RepID=UPI00094B20CA|nr:MULTISPECIES: hypothetical protein [unclassified Pseudonocardia]OLM11849.1 hypothetical protein Ae505Ps2_1975c [Pseudonocardia sp. Ae505_Ps2]OLM29241.1 hypothetical protein Ae717Ps2_0133c [Pseudonocardia sp. Ae717_Ps2]